MAHIGRDVRRPIKAVWCAFSAVIAAQHPTFGDAELWRGLVVAPEDRCAPYDRGDYRYPPSVEDAVIAELGDIFSPYTCTVFRSKQETEIEHMVALSEAHDSGLCAADRETKRQFAREIGNLTLAAPRLNRSKGSRDAAEWLPASNRCWFADRVVQVRRAYRLTIDRPEADALEGVLSKCGAGAVRAPFCAGPSSFVSRFLPVILRATEANARESRERDPNVR